MQQSFPLEQYCRHCLDGGGAFTQPALLRQVLAANKGGMKKSDIITLLNGVLQRLEPPGRELEFEVVAELNQRIIGFFSPGGVIMLDEDPNAAGPSADIPH
ncbi:hypothetical protein [Duganella sp. HH105]|uniref:hypothetical protein n=1 Tax=Duganella sp. HH105 TaxID=1781067 RepID=UPI000877D0D8|nr:hypothetical protein [Duganella sp. HH105]OEZ62017.1 hypothetical protein DUGA6_17010 [Duganella sp. HH105]